MWIYDFLNIMCINIKVKDIRILKIFVMLVYFIGKYKIIIFYDLGCNCNFIVYYIMK